MNRLRKSIDELIEALCNTDEYKQYKEVADSITVDELEKINEYKRLRFEAVNGGVHGENDESVRLYSKLMLNAVTRNYMLCEKKIYNIVADIYDEIGRQLIN